MALGDPTAGVDVRESHLRDLQEAEAEPLLLLHRRLAFVAVLVPEHAHEHERMRALRSQVDAHTRVGELSFNVNYPLCYHVVLCVTPNVRIDPKCKDGEKFTICMPDRL